MKITVKVTEEVEVRFLQVKATVRYWEDATVNGEEDTEGTLISCRKGDYWKPIIDLKDGSILDWNTGDVADIHYKVCDAGTYTLLSNILLDVKTIEGYVPSILCPEEEGYGDYIIMKVDKDGYIQNWKVDLSEFSDEEQD